MVVLSDLRELIGSFSSLNPIDIPQNSMSPASEFTNSEHYHF